MAAYGSGRDDPDALTTRRIDYDETSTAGAHANGNKSILIRWMVVRDDKQPVVVENRHGLGEPDAVFAMVA